MKIFFAIWILSIAIGWLVGLPMLSYRSNNPNTTLDFPIKLICLPAIVGAVIFFFIVAISLIFGQLEF